MFDKDSVFGTMLVVLLVSLVCSVVVSGSAVSLKPIQEAQKLLDKQKNILSVAGLYEDGVDISKVFAESIDPRLVDLDTGKYVDFDPKFDAKQAAKDPAQSIALAPEDDLASIRRRANLSDVYLVKDASGKVTKMVLPIYGTGLWSVMYGFVSVKPDGNTLDGITFYDHGETPGLGGEIENPKWQSQFVGKKLFDKSGTPGIKIAKGASQDQEHGIDSLSGATLTSNGVQGTFDLWFGKKGFGPFLENVQAGRL